MTNPETYLRLNAVKTQIGLSRSTIYKLMDEGDFPRPVKLTSTAVAWRQSDIDAKLATRSISTGDRGKK